MTKIPAEQQLAFFREALPSNQAGSNVIRPPFEELADLQFREQVGSNFVKASSEELSNLQVAFTKLGQHLFQ